MTTELPAIALPAPGSAARDFYELRREGIGFIADMGADHWTDYNTHDPGITILEALSYAITELAYRTDFPIADILRSGAPPVPSSDPYPDQPFFTARSILTINPTTPDDFRRLLIDLDTVSNAWVRCRTCACDVVVYAWCEQGRLTLSYDPSARLDPQTPVTRVEPRGLYDVALQLEDDDTLGDLNDRKLVSRRTVFDQDGRPHQLTIEVRFPAWNPGDPSARDLLVHGSAISTVTVSGPTRTKTDPTPVDNDTLHRHWQHIFYISVEVELASQEKVTIPHASLRLFGDRVARDATTVPDLVAALADTTPAGFVARYRDKLIAVDRAIDSAKTVLHAHRNLDEDYCRVRGIDIEDIAVCADIEVRPDADIEWVQASIWFEIEQYLNPHIAFHFLDELVAAGTPVEAIFNGPEMNSGFLTEQDLQAAGLRTIIRVSDVVDRLMEIPGVIAVNNMQVTAYDAEGQPIKGVTDPAWNDDGSPRFDSGRVSGSWLLFVSDGHQPRLYRNLSRFLFSSNGLPFRPRVDEAEDTLVALRGAVARPKLRNERGDLPVPTGADRDLDAYFPVQHSFPLTYGIGPAGLPSTATPLRRAQAKQLKAYLLVFEQVLRNAYAQLAHTADLFSLAAQDRTYFFREFTDNDIDGYTQLVNGLTAATLASLGESETEFADRRNRFLDHILARFGEQFSEYAMLLTGFEGERAAKYDLIGDKIAFLRAYPEISHDRGKAFNRNVSPCSPANASGLKKRVSLLLGFPDHSLVWSAASSAAAPGYTQSLALRDRGGNDLLTFTPSAALTTSLEAFLTARGLLGGPQDWEIVDRDGQLHLLVHQPGDEQPSDIAIGRSADAQALSRALVAALLSILAELVVTDRYRLAPNGIGAQPGAQVVDAEGALIGEHPGAFDSTSAVESFRDGLLSWSANERATVVEHLLLRPKFPGDALYPVCTDGECATCGEEDPYSFRLTFVMPGWTAPFSTNMEMRGFAEGTIQQETPSHLVVKTCWVGNDGFVADPCDPVVDELAEVLEEHWGARPGAPPSREDVCACATAVLEAYRAAFDAWYAEKTLEHHRPEAVKAAIAAALAPVDVTAVGCAAVIDDALRTVLNSAAVKHFSDIALRGRQFDRFEDAWCKWLSADARIDWTEERLQEVITAILTEHLTSPATVAPEAVCGCAADILTAFGSSFAEWRDANIAAGTALDGFTAFDPDPIALCPDLDFRAGTADAVRALLMDRYASYTEVSYRLRLLVDALSELHNTYPSGTLHDCDEGSDRNPIRLGQTALGSNVQ